MWFAKLQKADCSPLDVLYWPSTVERQYKPEYGIFGTAGPCCLDPSLVQVKVNLQTAHAAPTPRQLLWAAIACKVQLLDCSSVAAKLTWHRLYITHNVLAREQDKAFRDIRPLSWSSSLCPSSCSDSALSSKFLFLLLFLALIVPSLITD